MARRVPTALIVAGCVSVGALAAATVAAALGDKTPSRIVEVGSDHYEVSAEVDESACASDFGACGNGKTGHRSAAASSANHNPVSIVVLVTRNGLPAAGFSLASFVLSDRVGPPGGPTITLCPKGGSGCTSGPYPDVGNGLYRLWVHPEERGRNWAPGSYYAAIRVKNSGASRWGAALIEIRIRQA